MSMIEINLLPSELRRTPGSLNLPKSAIAAIAVGVVVVAALGALTVWQTMRLSRVDAQIVRAQARVESMKDDIALVDRLTSVKQSIAMRLEAIETLDRNRGEWVRNLEDIAAVIPDYLWLSSFRRNDLKQTKPGVGAQQKQTADTAVMVNNDYLFEGYCYSLSSLANLILNMQDSPRFDDVALKRATFTDVKDRKVYQFLVYCLLQPYEKEGGTGDEALNPAELGTGPDPNEEAIELTATQTETQRGE